MESRKLPSALWSTESLEADDFYDSDTHNVEVGLVTFDAEHGIEVEMPSGALLNYPISPEGVRHHMGVLTSDVIYGYAQNNKYYVLRDVIARHTQASYPGFETQVLLGLKLFISSRPIQPNPMVRRINVSLPGLREWVGQPPFDVTEVRSKQTGRLEEVSMLYRWPSAADLLLYYGEAVDILVRGVATMVGGPIPNYEFGFRTDCMLDFVFSEPLEFDAAMEQWVRPTINFLAYCMGFRYPASSIKLTTEEGVNAEYLAGMTEPQLPFSVDRTRSMPFPYWVMLDRISEMLAKWFELDDYGLNASMMLVSLVSTQWTALMTCFSWQLPRLLRRCRGQGRTNERWTKRNSRKRLRPLSKLSVRRPLGLAPSCRVKRGNGLCIS